MKTKNFKRGDQIVYIPNHLINLPFEEIKDDYFIEYGFVTSTDDEFVFCRFWRSQNSNELRTAANSESCYPRNLRKYESHTKGEIDLFLEKMK